METSRRNFIKQSLGFALGLSMSESPAFSAETSGKLPIGFQLYTVRGEFERDVPGTIKKLAEIGYKGVEFWGYGGTANVYQKYSAKELRGILDDNGLKCCGIHLEIKALASSNLRQTIENNKVLGNPYLNVAGAKDKMESETGINELAGILNDAAEKCRPQQMVVGYHAHPFDFVKHQGRFAWDLLFSRTNPEVKMQMDVGNCLAGDGDPVGMLKKFPGRTPTIHIKEFKNKVFSSDYYKEVFALCEGPCATKWYIVEMGSENGTGFEIPGEALASLRKSGK